MTTADDALDAVYAAVGLTDETATILGEAVIAAALVTGNTSPPTIDIVKHLAGEIGDLREAMRRMVAIVDDATKTPGRALELLAGPDADHDSPIVQAALRALGDR